MSKENKKCKFCGDRFPYNLSSHQKACPHNPENKTYCKECGELLTRKWQTDFCSNSCAAKFNNRSRDCSFSNKTKNQPCAKCGKEIEVNIHAGPNTHCTSCKEKQKEQKRRCPYCGRLKCRQTNKICKWLSKGGLSTFKKIGGNESIIGTAKIFDHVEDLIETLYDEYQNGESTLTLENKYNISHQTIGKILNEFEEGTREYSKAGQIAIRNKRIMDTSHLTNTDFKSGHHKTWYGKKVFLRSSYEFDYAKELDEEQVYYEVESLRIPYEWNNKEHIYVPDFYIPNQNLVVEVKSQYFYEKDKERVDKKLDACEQCGYETKLVIPE